MSFLPINEENNQAPTGQTTNQPGQTGGTPPPASTSGGSAGAGQAGGAAVGAASGSPTQFGSSASKLGDYLSANAPQVQGQANNVAGSLTNQYQGVSGDINNAANQFGQQVQGGYTAADPNLVSQAASNPTGFANTPGNVAGFQSQLNDQYTGPASFETTTPYANIQNEVNTSVQNAGLLNTQQGLQNYFGQTQGGNQTAGTNTLDTLLLQGNQPAYQTVQNAANQFQNLTPQFQQTTAGADQGVTAAQQSAQQASQNALNAFTGSNGTLTNLNNTINTGTANDISQAQAQQASLNADIANLYGGQAADTTAGTLGTYGGGTTPWGNTTNYTVGNLSPQDLASLGMTQDQANALQQAMQTAGTSQMMTGNNFGAGSQTTQDDLTQYLQENNPATAYTNANTATAPQYQEMAAIQQLLGAQAPQTGNAIDQSTATQAGQLPAYLNSFNYGQALSDAQNFGTQARTDAQGEANMIAGNADVQHAQSQHSGGLLGGVARDLTNPLQLSETLLNPMSYAANTQAILEGKGINPTNINQPYAQQVAPVLGGALGYIYGGGPVGGVAGATAGKAVGGAMQNLGGKKTLAHGGIVLEDYLKDK